MVEDPEDDDVMPEEALEGDPLEGLGSEFAGGDVPAEDVPEAATSGMPRMILVDVASVAEGGDPLRSLWQQNRTEAATRLVDLLSWAMATEDAELVLVLERAVASTELLQGTHGMRMHLTAPKQTVSEVLFQAMDEAVNMGRNATVVTSDIDVIRRASECHLQAVLGDLFAISLLGGTSRAEEDDFTEPPGLSAREKAEWQAFVQRWQQEKKG